MPRNGSGTFSVYTPGNPVVTGSVISSTAFNATMTDIATGLTGSIAKDGQTTPTANLPMGSYKHTGVAVGAALTDYARYDQLQNSSPQWLTSVSGTDTITASATVAPSAYAAGQVFRFVPAGANTTAAVTLNVNSLGAKNVYWGASAVPAGAIQASAVCEVTYDGTQFQLVGMQAVGTSAGNLVRLDSSAKLPAVDGSQLTNVTGGGSPPVRQTVLSGPVDSGGLPNFGGSTGSTTVTASGTLTCAFANGFDSSGSLDKVAQITNPSWTGLSTNGTMYLYVDWNSGSPTTGSTTLAPTYQWGGTYSTTNNQHTYNIQEMIMKVGNGSSASQTYRVFVGEVTVAGGVVTAITWYALLGRYVGALNNTLPAASTQISANHNIGVTPRVTSCTLRNLTTEGGYAVGDEVSNVWSGRPSSTRQQLYKPMATRLSMSLATTDNSPSHSTLPAKAGGNDVTLTAANWAYRLEADRGW